MAGSFDFKVKEIEVYQVGEFEDKKVEGGKKSFFEKMME
jgi:hypothetical protein